MEGLTPQNILLYSFYLTCVSTAAAVISMLFQIVATKVSISSLAESSQKKRFTITFWFLLTSIFLTGINGVLVLKPFQLTASANGEETSVPPPCPEVGEKKGNEDVTHGVRERQTIKGGKEVLINTIQYGYSPFAVMGKFPLTIRSMDGQVNIFIPNTAFRVASKSQDGRVPRIITTVRVGVGEASELAKIKAGKKGVADWSESFPVNLEIEPNNHSTPGPQINVQIPIRLTKKVTNKAIIIEMKNETRDTHVPLDTCYALSKEAFPLN